MLLAPEHRADLDRSGLTEETMNTAGIHTVLPDKIDKLIPNRPLLRSVYVIPYPGTDFARYRLFPPQKDKNGHAQKYHQAPGSPPRLYIPPGFQCPDRTWRITEGEKKALKGTQEGLNVLGLGGIWNYAVKDENGQPRLIDNLVKIPWDKKIVEIIPDGDFQIKDQVAHAVYRLAAMLEEKGAEVRIVVLPASDKLDDYLCAHPPDEFSALPRMTFEDPFFRPFTVKESGKIEAIRRSVLGTSELLAKTFPPRPYYLKPWLRTGTLSMIYAPPGTGKSYFSMVIALAVTRRASIGSWGPGEELAPVLLIDGELPGDEIQERLNNLSQGLGPELAPLHFLSSECMCRDGWPTINLWDEDWRDALFMFLREVGIYRLLILDNLASLIVGTKENQQEDWTPII